MVNLQLSQIVESWRTEAAAAHRKANQLSDMPQVCSHLRARADTLIEKALELERTFGLPRH